MQKLIFRSTNVIGPKAKIDVLFQLRTQWWTVCVPFVPHSGTRRRGRAWAPRRWSPCCCGRTCAVCCCCSSMRRRISSAGNCWVSLFSPECLWLDSLWSLPVKTLFKVRRSCWMQMTQSRLLWLFMLPYSLYLVVQQLSSRDWWW